MKKAEKESKARKIKMVQYEPVEEKIREKAWEIYCQRTDRGEKGTAVSDWLIAEAWLKE